MTSITKDSFPESAHTPNRYTNILHTTGIPTLLYSNLVYILMISYCNNYWNIVKYHIKITAIKYPKLTGFSWHCNLHVGR